MSGSEHGEDISVNPKDFPPMIESNTPGTANDDAQASKSRRRRRPADPEKQARNQSFYFVDSNSSSKEKRAHVMRHHVQEKRKQSKRSHGTIPTEQNQLLPLLPARKDPEDDTDNVPKQDPPLPIRFAAINPYPPPTTMQLGSPMTIADASSSKQSLGVPFAQSPEDLELTDYWINKLTYWSGQNLHMKKQIFRFATEHPVPFQAAILTYCARWKAQIHETPNHEELQRHLNQARKNIHDATVGSLQVHPDHLATALSGMALGEERFGNKQDAQVYLEQASQIMRPRPGSNNIAEAFLHYVRFILPPLNPVIEPGALQWLVAFLRGAEDLMQKHSVPEFQAEAPARCDVFQMECPLFSLLSSGPRPSQVPYASRVYVVRDPQTQEVSRTASLIYITAALWDFKDSADKTNRFLIYLKALVEQHELDRQPACETLLWLLLEQGCDSDLQNPERAWSVSELLRAHRLLRPEVQFDFNEILMSFLTLRPPIRGIDVFQEELQEYLK